MYICYEFKDTLNILAFTENLEVAKNKVKDLIKDDVQSDMQLEISDNCVKIIKHSEIDVINAGYFWNSTKKEKTTIEVRAIHIQNVSDDLLGFKPFLADIVNYKYKLAKSTPNLKPIWKKSPLAEAIENKTYNLSKSVPNIRTIRQKSPLALDIETKNYILKPISPEPSNL